MSCRPSAFWPAWFKTETRANPAPGYLEIWKLASELTSVYHEMSLHVGGVVLTPAPADRCLPLDKSAKGFLMSHYDRDAVEDLKLIKLDLRRPEILLFLRGRDGDPRGRGRAEVPDHRRAARLLPAGRGAVRRQRDHEDFRLRLRPGVLIKGGRHILSFP